MGYRVHREAKAMTDYAKGNQSTLTIVRVSADGLRPEGDKRQYLPFTLSGVCGTCGKACAVDLRKDYLSCPKLRAPTKVHLLCSDADCNEWTEFKAELTYQLVKCCDG